MSENPEIRNPCKDCVFLTGKTCRWNRLEKLAANGATIEYEDNVPVVVGRFCSAKRRANWLQTIKQESNVEVVLRAEILVRTEVYIYLEKFHHKSLETTLESLKRQVLKPSLVVVVCNGDVKTNKIFRLLDESELPYRVDVIKDKKNRNQSIDIAASKCTSTFYQVLDQGQYLHKNTLATLDERINVDMERFVYITAGPLCGETVLFLAHKNFFGNEPCRASLLRLEASDDLVLNNLQEKLEFVSKLEGNEYYVRETL